MNANLTQEQSITNETAEKLKERLNRLLIAGKQVEATSQSIDVNNRPDYFNEERFQRAQAVCQKYFTNISFGSTTGLMLLMQFESILVPLLKTGKSRTVPDLYDRYMTTAKYMRKCYETNFYQPTSEGWKYINLVSVMHQRIHKLMKEDPSVKQVSPNVWVNQYDMALTQFAFIGLFLLRPNKCGAYYITEQELADIVYYWHLISYYFCIEERFNLFVYHDDLDTQLEFLGLVLEHMKEELVKTRMEVGLKMAKGFMLAFEDLVTDLSFSIVDNYWSPYISLSGQSEQSSYTISDRWKLPFFFLYFKILFRSEMILGIINNVYKKKFDEFCASGDRIKVKLSRKYRDHIYE